MPNYKMYHENRIISKCPFTAKIDLDTDSLKQLKKNKSQESKRILSFSGNIYVLTTFPCEFLRVSQLRKLRLNFKDFGFVHSKTFIKLANNLRNLQRLIKLKLLNLDLTRIYDDSLICFSDNLSHLTLLESLNLNFNNICKMTELGYRHLTQSFIRLEKLKKLSFGMNKIGINCDCLKFLQYSLIRLKTLKRLHIILGKCHSIEDEAILGFIQTITLTLKELSSLSLDILDNAASTNIGCSHVINSLKNLPRLNKINLNFNNHFTDNELSQLSESLQRYKDLNALRLSLKHCRKVDSSGLYSLKNSLADQVHLKDLHLDFFWGNSTALIQIGTFLPKLVFLKRLSLSFESSSQLNDNGLGYFNKALKKLVNLKDLNIYLNCCDEITDVGLGQLSVVISKLNFLVKLQINLSWSKYISEAGVKQISIALSRLPQLKKLKLNLKGCKNIADDGLLRLNKALKGVKTLKKLYLDFSWCRLLTEGVIQKIKQDINFIQLNDSNLNFSCSE